MFEDVSRRAYGEVREFTKALERLKKTDANQERVYVAGRELRCAKNDALRNGVSPEDIRRAEEQGVTRVNYR